MPGENVDITINGDRNSLIGLMVVDQSALINIGGNNIEELKIFEELSRFNYDSKSDIQKNPNSTEKIYSDFQASNAVVLTNAKKEYGENLNLLANNSLSQLSNSELLMKMFL